VRRLYPARNPSSDPSRYASVPTRKPKSTHRRAYVLAVRAGETHRGWFESLRERGLDPCVTRVSESLFQCAFCGARAPAPGGSPELAETHRLALLARGHLGQPTGARMHRRHVAYVDRSRSRHGDPANAVAGKRPHAGALPGVRDSCWEGEEIVLRDLATTFGTAYLTAHRESSRVPVDLDLTGHAPELITVRHPGARMVGPAVSKAITLPRGALAGS
jgi:hypothetical protein